MATTRTVTVVVDTSAGAYAQHDVVRRLRRATDDLRAEGTDTAVLDRGVAFAAAHLADDDGSVSVTALTVAAVTLVEFADTTLDEQSQAGAAMGTAAALLALADSTVARTLTEELG